MTNRNADKFVVRLKPGQRDRVKARAKTDNQAMNDVVLTALDKHLDQGEAFDELLRIVQRAIQPTGGSFVSIRRDYLSALVNAAGAKLASTSEPMVAAAAVLHVPE